MTSQVPFATQVLKKEVAPKASPSIKGSDSLTLLNSLNAASRSAVNSPTISVLQPVSESRKVEMSSRLDSKANSQSSLPSSGSKNYALSPHQPNFHLSSNLVLHDDSEKENSQESLNDQKSRISATRSKKSRPVAKDQEQDASKLLIAYMPERYPFQNMKRVPRSYVRIPENQQVLLDREDSWYQPEAEGRSSFANIPPDVMRDLNSHVDGTRPGRELLSAQESELETGESSDDVDEDSDVEEEDGTGEVDNPEEISHLPKDNERHNISTSDDESVHTWSESHYGDVEPDNMEEAPGSSPFKDLNIDNVEADNEITSLAADLPSVHNSSPPRPIVFNLPIPLKVNSRINYNFPSSSPGDEQELEIAVPYAIDDEVEVNDEEMAEEPKTSPELPSTDVQNKPVIEVEHTPDHHAREAQEFGNGKRPVPKLHPPYFKGAKEADESISSDPIIPATFHDPSLQDHLPASKRRLPSSSDKRIHSETSSPEAHLNTLKEDVPTAKDSGMIDEGDEMAEVPLFTEPKSSQHKRSQPINLSSVTHPSPLLRAFRSPTPTRIERCNTHQNVLPSLRSPQQPTSSAFHTALPEMRTEDEKPWANETFPANSKFSEPGNESPQTAARKLKKRPFRQSLAAAASQGDGVARNTNDWVKAARHSFHAQYSSPLEKPPVVQIAQSQPKSARSRRSSPSRQPADDIFPQSSNEYVRSSVPEKSEQITVVEHTTEELAEITSISRVQSPTVLEGTQPSKASSRSPKLSLSGILEVTGDLDMARTSTVDSKGHAPDMQKRSTNKAVKHAVKDEVEIVSIYSYSEEELVGKEELADEDEFTGDVALVNEKDQQLAYIREANRERYPSPEPNEGLACENDSSSVEEPVQEEEDASEQQLTYNMEASRECSHSPEPTAFEIFKSVYPSYSGGEKDFVWALVYIEWLVESKGDDFLRPSLWDDFIRTLAAEFLEYMREARKSQLPRDKIKTGFAFFNKLDKPPIFQNRLITPHNLANCLLTLDAVQVEKLRLQFKASKSPLADPPRPGSPHGPPSIALKNSHNNQSKGKSVADILIEIAAPSEPNVIPELDSLKAPKRALLKRPFFETLSQLQSAKRSRAPHSPEVKDISVEIPRTSKRRPLPWGQNNSPQPSNTPSSVQASQNEPVISAPTSSSRMNATTQKLRGNRRASSSTSFHGSPASPILGEAEPATRSFTAIDIRTGFIGSSPLNKFETPSARISKAALQRVGSSSSINTGERGKVEGWLEQKPSPVNPEKLFRKEAFKRKRDSELKLLDMSTPEPKSKSKRVASGPLPSIATSRTTITSSVRTNEVKTKTSFKEFLKQRRASGLSSTPASRNVARHMEPDTQAWGP